MNPKKIFIFGGTGDLSKRYLIPACLSHIKNGKNIEVYVLGRRDFSASDITDFFSDIHPEIHETWRFFYKKIDITDPKTYGEISDVLTEKEDTLFYLSVAPKFFSIIAENLAKNNLEKEVSGKRILLVEKPFGYDLKSAIELNSKLQEIFHEDQIYRIDHYLGKPFVSDILKHRLSNEPIWDDAHIKTVHIRATESINIGSRWEYYDGSGALRDMIQNHLLQIFAIIAMDYPEKIDEKNIRDKKADVLKQILPFLTNGKEKIIFGQYSGYLDVSGVKENSRTETYVKIEFEVENPRWKKTKFILETGKALNKKYSGVTLTMANGSEYIFSEDQKNRVNSYEKLILDALSLDPTLFIRWDSIKTAWEIVNELVHCRDNCPLVHLYTPGSTGPVIWEDE